jgi:hypothetical protein
VAALLLLLDQRARRGLHAALKLPLSLLLIGGNVAHVESAIRATGRQAIVQIRQGSREASRDRWQKTTGLIAIQAFDGRADELAAIHSANALADSWAHKLDVAGARVDAQGSITAESAARTASTKLGPSIDRTASTEAMHAWNDEVVRQNDHAEDRGHFVTETWNAMLDACPVCADLDQSSVTRPERFAEYPPMHPHCQCWIDTELEAA